PTSPPRSASTSMPRKASITTAPRRYRLRRLRAWKSTREDTANRGSAARVRAARGGDDLLPARAAHDDVVGRQGPRLPGAADDGGERDARRAVVGVQPGGPDGHEINRPGPVSRGRRPGLLDGRGLGRQLEEDDGGHAPAGNERAVRRDAPA